MRGHCSRWRGSGKRASALQPEFMRLDPHLDRLLDVVVEVVVERVLGEGKAEAEVRSDSGTGGLTPPVPDSTRHHIGDSSNDEFSRARRREQSVDMD